MYLEDIILILLILLFYQITGGRLLIATSVGSKYEYDAFY